MHCDLRHEQNLNLKISNSKHLSLKILTQNKIIADNCPSLERGSSRYRSLSEHQIGKIRKETLQDIL
jgi:hypothetical protein